MASMRQRFISVLMVLLLFAISNSQAQSQTNDRVDGFVELEKIVITPGRQAMPLKDSPSRVRVVSKEDIKETGAQTLEGVFKYIPDVDIVGDSVYQAMKPQITLRGVPGQERTLVMIDGIPLNSAWQGRVEWGMVPVDAIERIELAYGPMSALYGSGAMGGAVNIITQSPKEPSQATISNKYGSMDSWSSTFLQSGKLEKLSYYFGGGIFKTAGYIPEKDPQPYSVNRRYQDWNSLLKLVYSPDEDSQLGIGFLHNDVDTCRGRSFFNIKDQTNLGYLTYDKSFAAIKLKGNFYINNQDWERQFDKGPNYDYLDMIEDIDHSYTGAMLEAVFSPLENNTLIAGLDYKHGKVRLRDEYQTIFRESMANGRQHLAAVFLQDEIKLMDNRFIATFGLRGDNCKSYRGWCFDTGQAKNPKINAFSCDYNEKDWTALSPKASLLYHLREATDLRFSYGRAFHAPDLKQLYLVLARPTKTTYNNPELEPETLDSYEIGVSHNFTDKVILGLNYYYSRGDDFISTRTLSATTSRYDNINKVEMSGIETDLNYKINKYWSYSAGYAFHRSKIKEDASDPVLNGKELSLQPNHRVSSRIIYDNPRLFAVSAVLRYVGRMYADLQNTDKLKGYYTCDFQIARQLTQNTEFSLIFENAFDRQYDVPNEAGEDIRSAGRMITGSLTMKW